MRQAVAFDMACTVFLVDIGNDVQLLVIGNTSLKDECLCEVSLGLYSVHQVLIFIISAIITLGKAGIHYHQHSALL